MNEKFSNWQCSGTVRAETLDLKRNLFKGRLKGGVRLASEMFADLRIRPRTGLELGEAAPFFERASQRNLSGKSQTTKVNLSF